MFVVRLDGEPIFQTDEQVIGCRLMTSRGEAAAIGLSQSDGVVDIVLDRVAPGGPVRLDQLEAQANLDIRARGQEGQVVGSNPTLQNTVPAANQGAITTTLTKGDTPSSGMDAGAFVNQNPSKDLATGLQTTDSATLTNRIEAFGQHGDADKAISDHPAESGGDGSGQGAAQSGAVVDASSTDTTGGAHFPPAGALGTGGPDVGTPNAGQSSSTTGQDFPTNVPAGAQSASPVDASSTAGTLRDTQASGTIDTRSTDTSPTDTPPIGTVVAATSSSTPDVVTGPDASVASAAPTIDKVETITEFAREADGTIGVIQADGVHIKVKP